MTTLHFAIHETVELVLSPRLGKECRRQNHDSEVTVSQPFVN
jgi:hypothetical protein